MIMAFANNLNLDAISAPSNKLWSGKGETPVVMVHTDWTYTDTDKYLGIKGGKAGSSHGHMDAGSSLSYTAYTLPSWRIPVYRKARYPCRAYC